MLVNILFDEQYLPDVIDVVMDNSVQQHIKIIFSASHLRTKLIGGNGLDWLQKF